LPISNFIYSNLKHQHHNDIINKYGIYFLSFCWIAATLLHLHIYGPGTTLEAEKYIREANRLVNHEGLSASRFIFYLLTISIIWLSLILKIGLYGAIIIQLFYNLVALYFFYRALFHLFKFSVFPMVIVLMLIIFSPYSSWNVYLYTESVFYSSILLLLSALIINNNSRKLKTLFFVLVALILVILARPLGILLIFPTLLYFFAGFKKRTRFILIPVAIIGFILLIYVSNEIFSTTSDANITLAASQQCIICGVVPSTHSLVKLSTDGNPVFQLYYYVVNNFSQFLKLGVIKLKYFFLMTRDYYSTMHNLFLLAFIIPLYILSIVSVFIPKEKNYCSIYLFLVSSILLFAVTVMLQCDDFHNRFVLALFPFFLVMSAKTVEYYFTKSNIEK
jgi:hypothetical protein